MTSTQAIAVLCAAMLAAQNPYAFAQQPQSVAGSQDAPHKALTPAQLESLVAPIALYPDPILSQVLVASTYPVDIVQAGRWLREHPNLKNKELVDAAAKQPWDASVQALVVLPDVLKRLDHDVSWTSDLGNAFMAQEQDVMDAIQHLRQKARDAGALQSTKEQTVTTAEENNQTYIEIQPASAQVVYVPQYNPVAVWGPPPEPYPYPPIYYPPVPSTGAVVAASAVSFGMGMAVGSMWGGGGWGGWGGWGWGMGWGRGNNVIINNNFIRNNHFNRVNVGNGNRWVRNPDRGNNGRGSANRSGRYPGASRPTPGQVQQRLGQRGGGAGQGNIGSGGRGGQGGGNRIGQGYAGRGGQARPAQRPAGTPGQGSASRMRPGNVGQGGGYGIGNRNLSGRGSANRSAFGGMNQGGNRARMNGNRGGMSRGGGGTSRGGGGMSRGGGGMSRGGGGRARGGGGGARGGGRRR